MTLVTVDGIEELRGLVGETIGPSDWREVTQEMVDSFAELSGDDQWIHVDVERAKQESPFGGTVGGRRVSWPVVDRLVVRDGLVAERRSWFDPGVLRGALARHPPSWPRAARLLVGNLGRR